MATLRDRLSALFRYRVGKYDSQRLPYDLGIYGTTNSGANINENTAMSIATVYACTYRIASSIASLGLDVFEREGRDVSPAYAHPAFDLIKYKPNDFQTKAV